MNPLLTILGLLLLVSGAAKLRSAGKAGAAAVVLSVLELALGGWLALRSFQVPPEASGVLGVVVGSVGLLAVANVWHALRLAELRRKRELSEGSRLKAYLNYFSRTEDIPE